MADLALPARLFYERIGDHRRPHPGALGHGRPIGADHRRPGCHIRRYPRPGGEGLGRSGRQCGPRIAAGPIGDRAGRAAPCHHCRLSPTGSASLPMPVPRAKRWGSSPASKSRPGTLTVRCRPSRSRVGPSAFRRRTMPPFWPGSTNGRQATRTVRVIPASTARPWSLRAAHNLGIVAGQGNCARHYDLLHQTALVFVTRQLPDTLPALHPDWHAIVR